MKGEARWVAPKDVARAEGVGVASVYQWVRRGKVKARRTPGGQVRIQVDPEGVPLGGR